MSRCENNSMKLPLSDQILAVDFDGTCVTHDSQKSVEKLGPLQF